MFKKLYRNLLLLNISILSLLLLIIFASLYITTYQEMHTRIDNELTNILNPNPMNLPPIEGADGFRADRSDTFVVVLNSNNEIIEVESQLNTVTSATASEYLEQVTDEDGNFEVDNITWSYLKQEGSLTTRIAFINIQNETEVLNNSLNNYAIIFVISIALTTLISSLLTKKSIKPIKDSFNRQKQFVSDASHELKTPLTVINTNVDILLSEDETNNKWLKYIKSEVTRMSKLTTDLLYLSNVTELENKQIIKSRMNVSEKLESIVLGVEALVYENKLELDYEISPNIEIEFNSEQLHQIVMILIDNAIKYSNKNGNIHITLSEQNNNAYIKVRNTGNGISEEEIEHIFDRFYKIDKSRSKNTNSFGLGLPIAKSICENNNAKLNVSSVVNEYTEFVIKVKTA